MTYSSKTSVSKNRFERLYQNVSDPPARYRLKHRDLLKSGAVLGAAAMTGIHAPAIIASERSIKIATYGGYFEDSFIEHIYPAFYQATGIKVESVTQPDTQGG
jgi:putative spermidine/putrescine transport system substrate-binding protein